MYNGYSPTPTDTSARSGALHGSGCATEVAADTGPAAPGGPPRITATDMGPGEANWDNACRNAGVCLV